MSIKQTLRCKVEILSGHCEIRSWLEWSGDKLVGMGGKKTYDEEGKLIDCSESLTGASVNFANDG